MPNIVQRVISMLTRVFEHPEDNSNLDNFVVWQNYVDTNWSYYTGSMFDKAEKLASEIQKYTDVYDLYSNTKLLINPARQIVNFYVDNVYPGILSYDGEKLTNGQLNAIPFSDKTPQPLKVAIGQFMSWSNFQALKSIIVRHGAAIGSAFIEIIDDIQRGKVTCNPTWPGFVKDLVLDEAGNVKSYTVTYKDKDEKGRPYTYRKDVDNQTISYYKNDEPFDYFDNGSSTIQHGYGFCPAVWIKHVDYGSRNGLPAIAGSVLQVDEASSLVSHMVDDMHKLLESPMIFWAEGPIKSALGQTKPENATGKETDDYGSLGSKEKKQQKSTLILKGPPQGRIDTLAPDVNLSFMFSMLEVLQTEIKKEHPEVSYYDDLRAMSQTTGVAVERLVGDVATKVSEVAANYDRQLVKLFQMAVAIAGERANDGSWLETSTKLTTKQQKFLPFNLTSYDKDELELNIEPRPLIRTTIVEKAEERTAYWQGVKAATDGGDVLELVLKDDGWSEDRITAITQQQKDNQAKAQAIAGGNNSDSNSDSGNSDSNSNSNPFATNTNNTTPIQSLSN